MVYLGRGVISMRRRWIYLQICEFPIDRFLALHQYWDQAHGFHPIQSKITAKIAGKTIIITKMYQQMQDSDGNDQRRSYTVTNCLEWRHEIEHQFNSSTGCATKLWSSSNVKAPRAIRRQPSVSKGSLGISTHPFYCKRDKRYFPLWITIICNSDDYTNGDNWFP